MSRGSRGGIRPVRLPKLPLQQSPCSTHRGPVRSRAPRAAATAGINSTPRQTLPRAAASSLTPRRGPCGPGGLALAEQPFQNHERPEQRVRNQKRARRLSHVHRGVSTASYPGTKPAKPPRHAPRAKGSASVAIARRSPRRGRVLHGSGSDGLRLHAQLFEIQIAFDPPPRVFADVAARAQVDDGRALGVDHGAVNGPVFHQLLLRG